MNVDCREPFIPLCGKGASLVAAMGQPGPSAGFIWDGGKGGGREKRGKKINKTTATTNSVHVMNLRINMNGPHSSPAPAEKPSVIFTEEIVSRQIQGTVFWVTGRPVQSACWEDSEMLCCSLSMSAVMRAWSDRPFKVHKVHLRGRGKDRWITSKGILEDRGCPSSY